MEVHYDSITALCAAVPTAINAKTFVDATAGYSDDRLDWWGVPGKQAVQDVVRDGWAAGVARLFAAISNIEAPKPLSIKRRRFRTDNGDELDMHRVWRGQIDTAWQRTRRQSSKTQRTVRIVAQVGALCTVDAEDVFWRGAAVCVLADALSEAGYAVEILGYSSCVRLWAKSDQQTTATITFPIKAADAPLDVAALASVVCLAGFHRWFIFKARCAMKGKARTGMGSTRCQIPESQAEEGAIHVTIDDVKTEAAARAFVEKHLATFVE